MMGPQCNLYVPAPVLQQGENVVVGDVKSYIFTYYFSLIDVCFVIVFLLNYLDFKLFSSFMIIGCAGFIYINMYIFIGHQLFGLQPKSKSGN